MHTRTSEYWKMMGDKSFKMLDYSGAVSCYAKAIELNAENPDAWHCMGVSYDNLEKHDESTRCFHEEHRIRGEIIKQKNNPGSGKKVKMHPAFSPIRIVSIGLILTFLSGFLVMVLIYELLGTIDWVDTVLVGLITALIFLGRVVWKQR
jgi:hypothetical protein